MKPRLLTVTPKQRKQLRAGETITLTEPLSPQPERPLRLYECLPSGDLAVGYEIGPDWSAGVLEYADGTCRPLAPKLQAWRCPWSARMRVKRTGEAVEIEVRFREVDGAWCWVAEVRRIDG